MKQIRWIGLPPGPFKGSRMIWKWRYGDDCIRYYSPYAYDHEGD